MVIMEKNTKISVYFPPKLDSDPTHLDVASQRKYSFVSEVIYVIVIAECTDQDQTEDELSAWKKDIEGCTVLTSVTDELSSAVASSENSNSALPNEKCSEQTKVKTHGYRQCPVKICHKVDTTDPLEQTHVCVLLYSISLIKCCDCQLSFIQSNEYLPMYKVLPLFKKKFRERKVPEKVHCMIIQASWLRS